MDWARTLGLGALLLGSTELAHAQEHGLRFDGATGYGQAVGGAPIHNSTWEFWLKLDEVTPGDQTPAYAVGWWGGWTGTGALIRRNGGMGAPSGWGPHSYGPDEMLAEGGLEQGRWYHVAYVFTGDCAPGVTVYLDGALLGDYGPGSHCPSSGIATTLAAYNYLGWGCFLRGTIDEVRISPVRRYEGAFTPEVRHTPDAQTWGLWHFDAGAGSVAADEIAGRDFSLHGGYEWVAGVTPGCDAANFCTGAPNSLGAGASLSMAGTAQVSANDFSLVASGAAASSPGLFVYSDVQAQEPFGDGVRCVGTSPLGVYRLSPTLFTDGAGGATRQVDLLQGPAASGPGAITPGSTRYFQFWYRDVAAGGSGFNATDGLEVVFCP